MKKLSRKSLVAIALVVAIGASLAIGGTLAYFTDTTEVKDNVFTLGNVDIELHESNGTAAAVDETYSEWLNNQVLLPGTQTTNAIKKMPTVTNTGSQDAWVWVDFGVPADLCNIDANGNYNATYDSLHVNTYGQFLSEYYDATWDTSKRYVNSPIEDGIVNSSHEVIAGGPADAEYVAVADGLWTDAGYIGTKDGYAWFRVTMDKPLPAGKTSLPALRQVYMDWRVTPGAEAGSYVLNAAPGETAKTYNGTWDLKVQAFAVQSAGIENVTEAIAAYQADNP